MFAQLLSFKFLTLSLFILSTAYTHFRGQVRFKAVRQLFDHTTLFAPINALMYLFSSKKNQVYLDVQDFPELAILQENWEVIRDEVYALMDNERIRASDKYDDIGFNSFFRTGWKRFYLKWYGDYLPSALVTCPKTLALLKTIPKLNGAMFALLPKGGHLAPHRDPYAGSLRYHLGLITPNSEKCRIYVDGIAYHWKDGESVIFDETYIHSAVNESDIDRVILFCDIDRPLRSNVVAGINRMFGKIIMAASAAPNMQDDPVGVFNRSFKYLYQVRLVGKRLKKFNRHLYYAVKYALYFALFYFAVV